MTRAQVSVDGACVGSIGDGVVVLVGVETGDDERTVERAVQKLAEMRIFPDGEGRMNRDLAEAGGSFLIVSQFTLAASLERGRRPSFSKSAASEIAQPLVADLASGLRQRGYRVEQGRFGAMMQVELTNDGPVTFVLDF